MSKFVFFYGHQKGKKYACLSNWYPAQFEKNGNIFSNTEQYMMYRKALLMGDLEMSEKILKTGDPRKAKALGRKVSNWDEEKWVKNREQIMYDGCMLKFSNPENIEMRNELLSTRGKSCVECSPYDRIWGIGMNMNDSSKEDENNWKGLNLLGKTLDKVREQLNKV